MRSSPLALTVCAALAGACASPEPPGSTALEASQRVLAQGELVGSAGLHGGHVWLGIPFAAPPLGELRWRAPQPPQPWNGRFEALQAGARCPQLASRLEGAKRAGELVGDEDCLTLNLYAPAFAPDALPGGDARLPVMVWIHGGGNTIGTASFYDGSELAARHDMLVVMVNYRLGPIGWLRHAALREGASPAEQSGNFGNLDHLAALVWVQENIAAFGGDPGNVTIFGESAGGHDVLALLVSPLSRGLFHRAIVQSGGTSRSTVAEAENFRDAPDPGDPYSSNEILVRLLLRDGLASDRAQAKTRLAALSADEIAARLRRLEAAELYALYVEDTAEPGLGMIDHPRIFGDGVVLPAADFHDTLAAGHYGRMPVMLGSNRDENKLFLFSDPAHVRKLFGVLPRLRDAQRYERVASALSRTWKANSVDELAWRMQKVQGASVFAYRFDWDEEPQVFGSDLSQMLGAAHAFEIPFVFGHWDLGPEGEMLFDEENAPGRVALSDAMMSYWAEFAYSGDPGRGRDGSLPTWSAWGAAPGQEKYIVFDTAPDGGVRMASETVTLAEIAAELAGDTHGDAAERCALRTQLTLWWPRLEVELAESEEAAAIRVACAGTSGAGAGGE